MAAHSTVAHQQPGPHAQIRYCQQRCGRNDPLLHRFTLSRRCFPLPHRGGIGGEKGTSSQGPPRFGYSRPQRCHHLPRPLSGRPPTRSRATAMAWSCSSAAATRAARKPLTEDNASISTVSPAAVCHRIGRPGCSFGRIRGLSNDRHCAGRAPAAPVNHLRHWARTGVAAGGGGRWGYAPRRTVQARRWARSAIQNRD